MFLNVIMLAGIAGAVVPVVVHLLNRARYRSVDWGAMMFLAEHSNRERRSRQIRQWILLLARMAIVAMLALALARPVIGGNLRAFGQSTSVDTVILLDNSASMLYTADGHSRIDLARQTIRQILATLHTGDRCALIPLAGDNPTLSPLAVPIGNFQAIGDALDKAPLVSKSNGIIDMTIALKRAADSLEHGTGQRRQIFLICDRQAVNWRNVTDVVAQSWRQRASSGVGGGGMMLEFFVVPIGGMESDNIAIESIVLPMPQVIVNQPTDVEVTIHNYGPVARTSVPLAIGVNGSSSNRTTVNVSPGASVTVKQSIRIGQPGPRFISAQITAESIGWGNELYYAMDVSAPIPVLVDRGDLDEKKTDYLKLALMPFASAGRPGPDVANIRILGREDAFGDLESRKIPVVVLDGVREISEADARSLEQFVYGGGGLLVMPGPLTDLANLNQQLFRQGAGILPASVQDATGADSLSSTTISHVELSHPIFRFLAGSPNPTPAAEIGRYFPVVANTATSAVLANFANGLPFMVAANFGRGRVVLVASPLNENWGTLQSSKFFLPLTQSIVRYLAQPPSRNFSPGEIIAARFDEETSGKSATVVYPHDLPRQSVGLQSEGNGFVARVENTKEPGPYTVSAGGVSQLFAVQPTRAEFDLTPLSSSQWKALSDQLGFKIIEPTRTPLAVALSDANSPREMWGILLACVLGLGILELVLGRAGAVKTRKPSSVVIAV
jgi:hypothetical protein